LPFALWQKPLQEQTLQLAVVCGLYKTGFDFYASVVHCQNGEIIIFFLYYIIQCIMYEGMLLFFVLLALL
jgi:hypothetical protein